MKKLKRKYIKRNFALYRLSGMMGNLAHMMYEFRNDDALTDLITTAMDAVSELGYTLKVHRGSVAEAEVKEFTNTISINNLYIEFMENKKLGRYSNA
jgi:hypothetical protein